jgi:Tol biopolymer transport system component
VPGTEGAVILFCSPDSQFLGFGESGRLQRVDLSGGAPHVICDAQVWTVPTWDRGGTILFDQNSAGRPGIFRVSAAGGPVTQVTTVDREKGEREHLWPSFLPDGRRFFYSVATARADVSALQRAIHLASVGRPGAAHVADMPSRVTYVATRHVLYAQDGSLMVRPFDADRAEFTGDPVRVADNVLHLTSTGFAEFSASDNGVLAYRPRTAESELVWFDRTGKQIDTVGARAAYSSLRLSRDDRRFVIGVIDPRTGTGNLWIYDRASGIPTPFTSEPREAIQPMWSADGLQVFFRSARDGPPDIFQKRADGRGGKEAVVELEGVETPEDASADGRYLAFVRADRLTEMDIWLLPLIGARTPMRYLTTAAVEGGARFSPDGQWLAFTSTETGTPELYVARVDDAGARTRVSSAGGIGARWRRDSKELFYLALDDTVMAVPITLGHGVSTGTPRALFRPGPVLRVTGGRHLDPAYDVSADGQFLINRIIQDATRAPITVVQNWPSLLPK